MSLRLDFVYGVDNLFVMSLATTLPSCLLCIGTFHDEKGQSQVTIWLLQAFVGKTLESFKDHAI